MSQPLVRRTSALAAVADVIAAASGPLLRLSDGGPLAQFDLRGEAPAVAAVLGVAPPVRPNTVARQDDLSLLWLGPDQWLAVAPEERRAGLLATLKDLRGFTTVTDVSAARAALLLEGPGGRTVLATACALDLHPSAFPPGRCAQTFVARCHAIVEATGEDRWRLLIRPSVADHVALFLADAAETLKASV